MRAHAFTTFYSANFEQVYRAAYLSCGDSQLAQDATQEAYERAFIKWNRLRNEAWALGWVTTAAMRIARRFLRKQTQPVIRTSQEPYDFEERLTSRIELDVAIRSLPERQREATILFYLIDMPLPHIAEAMQISEGAVKAHLSQARLKLRGSLEVLNA